MYVILGEKTVAELKEQIAEMRELYRQMNEEGADTGFDADDIAIDVANLIDARIRQAESDDAAGIRVTEHDELVYRKVRRYYAEQDVKNWLADNEDEFEVEDFDRLVDRYDKWQGDNPFWYEAIADAADTCGKWKER